MRLFRNLKAVWLKGNTNEKVSLSVVLLYMLLMFFSVIWSFLSPDFTSETQIKIILAVLLGLSITEFSQRYGVLEDINYKIGKANNLRLQAKQKLINECALSNLWDNAKEIYIMAGTSTSLMSGVNYNTLCKKLNDGVKFRFITYEEGCIPMQQFVDGFVKIKDSREAEMKYLSDSIGIICSLIRENKGLIELRCSSTPMPFSIMNIVNKDNNNIIKIDLYTYYAKNISEERLSFIIYELEQKTYYDFFKNQFEIVWNKYEPKEHKSKQCVIASKFE